MMLNTYTLPELVDLALRVPEVGAVNFNILHAVLQSVIAETGLLDVRPWCRVDHPVVAQAALTSAKLRGAGARRRSLSAEDVAKAAPDLTLVPPFAPPKSRPADQKDKMRSGSVDSSTNTPPLTAVHEITDEVADEPTDDVTEPKAGPSSQPTSQESDQTAEETDDSQSKMFHSRESQTAESQTQDSPSRESQTTKSHSRESQTQKSQSRESQTKESQSRESQTKESQSRESQTKESQSRESQTTDRPSSAVQDFLKTFDDDDRKSVTEEMDEILKVHKSGSDWPDLEQKEKSRLHHTSWELTNLSGRVEGAEEGLMHLSMIVDKLTDKFGASLEELQSKKEVKGDSRPLSEEMEAVDERLNDIEETMEDFQKDHTKLKEMEIKQKVLTDEFEQVKSLGNQMGDMLASIERKADLDEMLKALALKGDLSLVMTKVDQTEFDTAIEELGEAIGSLAIKYQIKNEELDERERKVWDGIASKMSAEVFEDNRRRVDERLTAEMLGLRQLQEIVATLLMPEASATTKCLACGRPAVVAGGENIGVGDGDNYSDFKSKSFDRSEFPDDDFMERQRLILHGVQKAFSPKKQYSTISTTISIPYSDEASSSRYSPSSQSTTMYTQFSMQPVGYEFNTSSSPTSLSSKDVSLPSIIVKSKRNCNISTTISGSSQVPILPNIRGVSIRRTKSISRRETKPNEKKKFSPYKSNPRKRKTTPLVFTDMLLERFEKEEQRMLSRKLPREAESELSVERTSSRDTRTSRDPSALLDKSLEKTSNPVHNTFEFAPVRLMQSPLRRDIILNHEKLRKYSAEMNLTPVNPEGLAMEQEEASSSESSVSSTSAEKE